MLEEICGIDIAVGVLIEGDTVTICSDEVSYEVKGIAGDTRGDEVSNGVEDTTKL